MISSGATAPLSSLEFRRLASLYDLERYLFEVASPRFRDQHALSSYDFFAIVVWKSNRAKTNVKRGLVRAQKTAGELMAAVYQAEPAQAKVETLLQVRGIGLPIASAILTVCYPEEFTVLDYRAWETLRAAATAGLPRRFPQNVAEYLQYCQVCRGLAQASGLSLRDLDRALWASDWEKALLRFVQEE